MALIIIAQDIGIVAVFHNKISTIGSLIDVVLFLVSEYFSELFYQECL